MPRWQTHISLFTDWFIVNNIDPLKHIYGSQFPVRWRKFEVLIIFLVVYYYKIGKNNVIQIQTLDYKKKHNNARKGTRRVVLDDFVENESPDTHLNSKSGPVGFQVVVTDSS